jgi:ankyrin repeat protein
MHDEILCQADFQIRHLDLGYFCYYFWKASNIYNSSSYQKAWEQVFIKYGTAESLRELQRLFPKEKISETWEFSPLHEVILGILPMDLERTLQDQKYRKQVNLRDYKGRTPLHWAAIRGDKFSVSRLLDSGAQINAQDDGKATPIILAASSGSVRTLELLLLAGANVQLTDRRGGQALHYVSRHQEDIAPVKLLLRAGASVDCRNSLGHTPFIGAAIKNRYEIGAYLLQNGADKHNVSNNNDTALFESVFHNSHEFLQLLLREGAKHTSVNKSGSTILHAAALEADLKTINILDASKLGGLDIDLFDKNGKTALEISRQRVASPDGFQEAFERFLMTIRQINQDI